MSATIRLPWRKLKFICKSRFFSSDHEEARCSHGRNMGATDALPMCRRQDCPIWNDLRAPSEVEPTDSGCLEVDTPWGVVRAPSEVEPTATEGEPKWKEFRAIYCPTCDPDGKDPDILKSGYHDTLKLGDWRLIEDRFKGEVIALHKNGSIRVRLEDGRELDGWPQRTKPTHNSSVSGGNTPSEADQPTATEGGAVPCPFCGGAGKIIEWIISRHIPATSEGEKGGE